MQKDFAPIALYTDGPLLIVGRKTLPANNLQELIAWLKANPDKATSGTTGVGSPQHVAGVLFEKATGTHFQFTHYRGGGQVTQDLVGGQIDLVFSDIVTAVPQIRAGTIKAYAVMAKNRLALLARRSDHRRSRRARSLQLGVEFAVGADRNAAPDHRQTQRCRRRRVNDAKVQARVADTRPHIISARNDDARKRFRNCNKPKSTSGGRSSKPPA